MDVQEDRGEHLDVGTSDQRATRNGEGRGVLTNANGWRRWLLRMGWVRLSRFWVRTAQGRCDHGHGDVHMYAHESCHSHDMLERADIRRAGRHLRVNARHSSVHIWLSARMPFLHKA